jgi:hypothetical protein
MTTFPMCHFSRPDKTNNNSNPKTNNNSNPKTNNNSNPKTNNNSNPNAVRSALMQLTLRATS